MASKKIDWTDVLTEKLVDLFEARECLWKTTSELYSDRNERSKAATEIAKELNMGGMNWFYFAVSHHPHPPRNVYAYCAI